MKKFFGIFLLLLLFVSSVGAVNKFYGRMLTFPEPGDPSDAIAINTNWAEADSIIIVYGKTNPPVTTTIITVATRTRTNTIITGLDANTKYYYTIRNRYLNPVYLSDVDSFKTANVLGTVSDLVFWQWGDTQIDSSSATNVASKRACIDSIRVRLARGDIPYPDLIFHCGDHVQDQSTVAEHYKDWCVYFAVFDTLYELAPCLPVIGNHDGYAKTYNGTDSSSFNWRLYGGLPHNNICVRTAGTNFGDHSWTLDYQDIRFIAPATCCDHPYQTVSTLRQDSVSNPSIHWHWIDSLCTDVKAQTDINHVIVIQSGASLTPYPWTITNGGTDDRDHAYYDCVVSRFTDGSDSMGCYYMTDMFPLFSQDSVNAIIFESGGTFSVMTTLWSMHNYFDDTPILQGSGIGGSLLDYGSFIIAKLNSERFRASIENLQYGFPDAARVANGYPWSWGLDTPNYNVLYIPHHNKLNGTKMMIWE
jgi:hypothetical protein